MTLAVNEEKVTAIESQIKEWDAGKAANTDVDKKEMFRCGIMKKVLAAVRQEQKVQNG